MDVSSSKLLDHPFSLQHPYPKPYHSTSFLLKPLVFRPHLSFLRNSRGHFGLPKLRILSELLDNEAMTSTNQEKTFDASPITTKINVKINGGPGVIKRNTHGYAATNDRALNERAVKVLSQAGSKEASYTTKAPSPAWASIMQDAHISSYKKYMQGLYMRDHPPKEGLGIVEFLKGKNIFITGATGFLAKVLVEKILRVQPDVGQLFLLIKGDNVQHANKRLHDEIICNELFSTLRSSHGDSYEKFMERKLTAIVGNIATNNLGMDVHTMEALQRKLDIIVNSAASTTFDERYDHALNLNTKGAQRLMEFGRSCLHLQLFMHVSTAFVNGERKGVVPEKPFRMGYSIATEALDSKIDETPDISVDVECKVIQKKIDDIVSKGKSHGLDKLSPSSETHIDKQLQEAMKELGMGRAKRFGWQDTYVFTKAMGEMLVDSMRGQVPLVIVRPSVVESSFKDPFPGWMEGNRMMDPIIISYGKGQLPGFLVDPGSVLDVVPVDMVANAMLAAMARHAGTPGLEVYQVASSVVNPLVFSKLAKMSCEHFKEHPFMDDGGKPLNIPKLQLYQDMDSFMEAVTFGSQAIKEKIPSTSNAESLLMRRHNRLALRVKQQASYLANLYRPYTFYAGRFDNSKTQQLWSSLSRQEKETFGFDVSEIDWETYIKSIHIPGLRKHVLKGRGSNMI